MPGKSLGQIAYEAALEWTGRIAAPAWARVPVGERAYWEHIASAVCEATVRVLVPPPGKEPPL
jgi:hypothetical protein